MVCGNAKTRAMKCRFLLFATVLTVASACIANGVNSLQADRAAVEAAVIQTLSRNWSQRADLVITDLQRNDVEQIRQLLPELRHRLFSEGEFRSLVSRHSARFKNSIAVSVEVVQVNRIRAEVVAGTPLSGLSGARDRFFLVKRKGLWFIVRREPFEIA
jgi:hypothetical protein